MDTTGKVGGLNQVYQKKCCFKFPVFKKFTEKSQNPLENRFCIFQQLQKASSQNVEKKPLKKIPEKYILKV